MQAELQELSHSNLQRTERDITIANRTERKRAIELAAGVVQELVMQEAVDLRILKQLIADSDILINCTTLGMHPKTEGTIATADDMHSDLTVFDIVYNPPGNHPLKRGKEKPVLKQSPVR